MKNEVPIIVRLAEQKDVGAVAQICFEQEPNKSLQDYSRSVEEQVMSNTDPESAGRFMVALIKDIVVGHGKLFKYDSSKLSVKYLSPHGWYLNGVIIKPEFRRQGVASSLLNFRESYVRFQDKEKLEIFSIVSAVNEASIKYHLANGYSEYKRAEGFLNIKLKCGEGILFRKEL